MFVQYNRFLFWADTKLELIIMGLTPNFSDIISLIVGDMEWLFSYRKYLGFASVKAL